VLENAHCVSCTKDLPQQQQGDLHCLQVMLLLPLPSAAAVLARPAC
jgi:hypothetical protein